MRISDWSSDVCSSDLVPVLPASAALPYELEACKKLVAEIGYPVMMKASWGGGGRGMRVIESEADLGTQTNSARSAAKSAFGHDEVYVEKLLRRARHVEVQDLGDTHGNLRSDEHTSELQSLKHN